MPARFDDTHWPLIDLRLTGIDEGSDIEIMLAGLSRRLRRGRCALLFDTTEVVPPTLSQAQENVRLEGQWLRANQELVRSNLVAVAFVIPGSAVRFALSGVLLIAPLPAPHIVASSEAEARAYCLEALRKDSLRG